MDTPIKTNDKAVGVARVHVSVVEPIENVINQTAVLELCGNRGTELTNDSAVSTVPSGNHKDAIMERVVLIP